MGKSRHFIRKMEICYKPRLSTEIVLNRLVRKCQSVFIEDLKCLQTLIERKSVAAAPEQLVSEAADDNFPRDSVGISLLYGDGDSMKVFAQEAESYFEAKGIALTENAHSRTKVLKRLLGFF